MSHSLPWEIYLAFSASVSLCIAKLNPGRSGSQFCFNRTLHIKCLNIPFSDPSSLLVEFPFSCQYGKFSVPPLGKLILIDCENFSLTESKIPLSPGSGEGGWEGKGKSASWRGRAEAMPHVHLGEVLPRCTKHCFYFLFSTLHGWLNHLLALMENRLMSFCSHWVCMLCQARKENDGDKFVRSVCLGCSVARCFPSVLPRGDNAVSLSFTSTEEMCYHPNSLTVLRNPSM